VQVRHHDDHRIRKPNIDWRSARARFDKLKALSPPKGNPQS
jgi:hypothetical protein